MNPSDQDMHRIQQVKLREEAKRDRQLSQAQKLAGAVSLLRLLPESQAYRQACTPAARMAEERLLLQLHQPLPANAPSITQK